MLKKSLISVIIPAYNAEKTITKTIHSVLEQTFLDWELIIVNDGSQDQTLRIISEFKDTRIHIFSYPNSGAPVSRNRGLNQSSGQLISFLDADDLWTPDKLELQFNALQQNPQASVAYSWTDYINESGDFLHSGRHITLNGNVYADLLICNFLENGSNPLIRRSALMEVGGFDETLPAAQDWELYIRLAKHYQFVAVPQVQILYRTVPQSISSDVSRMETVSLGLIDKIFEEVPQEFKPLKLNSIAHLYKYIAFKTIDTLPQQDQGWMAAKYLTKAIEYDPSLGQNRKLIFIAWLKIIMSILLPSKVAFFLLYHLKKLKT